MVAPHSLQNFCSLASNQIQGPGSESAESYPLEHQEVSSVFKFNGFPGDSDVKNPPAMRETWVQSLGQEDPLEKEMATHSSILAWRIPWTENPGRLQSMGCKESDTSVQLSSRTCVREPPY